jgi:hypothetical protein
VVLLLLLGPCGLQGRTFDNAEKQGQGILRELRLDMVRQLMENLLSWLSIFTKIRGTLQDHDGAAGPAFVLRQLEAVDVGLGNGSVEAESLGHFGCREILALPAECVADAVGKKQPIFSVVADAISGPEPDVTFAEDRRHDLLGGCRLVAIVSLGPGLDVPGRKAEYELARLVRLHLAAETRVRVAV